jgi:hypothetical protein
VKEKGHLKKHKQKRGYLVRQKVITVKKNFSMSKLNNSKETHKTGKGSQLEKGSQERCKL